MTNETKGRPVAKPPTLSAAAYCLRLHEDGTWSVVDNSGRSVLGLSPADNPPRLDVATLGALEAMRTQARNREAWVLARMAKWGRKLDEEVVVFVAATREEASRMTGIPMAARVRK